MAAISLRASLAEPTDVLVLGDGTRLRLRPLGCDDRDGIAALFARLSPESRYRRFLSPKRELTLRELSFFTDIDHIRHEAFAAIDQRDGSILGVGRYVHVSDRPKVAEVAVAVTDELQNMGIGTALARHTIRRARENGFALLTATTLWENRPARALLRRLEFRTHASDGCEIELELKLHPPSDRRTEPDLLNNGQPISNSGLDSTRPDIVFSHNTPYVSWHETQNRDDRDLRRAGGGAIEFAMGDRVYGSALGRAAAEFVVVKTPTEAPEMLARAPDGISDEVASTLPVPGLTAAAALAAIDLRPGDTVLIGGAAGGVGVFAVQLAKLAGATVIGTASEGTFEFLRQLGAEPVAYGAGLTDRVRTMSPDGVSAATDLFGTETAETALALGLPERISAIAAGPNPPGGVRATGGSDAPPDTLEQITDAILAGKITVPIAATFPIEQIRDAVTLQAARHTHGKIVITL